MRLTFICRAPLLPIRNGEQSSSYNLICKLAPICDLTVILLAESQDLMHETISDLKSRAIDPIVIPSPPRSLLTLVLLAFLPRGLRQKISARIKKFYPLRDCLDARPDEQAIFFGAGHDLTSLWLASQRQGIALFPADSIALFEKAKIERRFTRRLLKPLKTFIMRVVEGCLYDPFVRHVLYVAKRDAEFAAKSRPKKGVVVHIGVNTDCEVRDYRVTNERIRLIFSGVMCYGPNLDASRILAGQLMPRIPSDQFELYLVGTEPPEEILAFARANRNVIVTGDVPRMEPFLAGADIFVSPIFSGAGAKNKILAALASGLIVVGSPASFAGLSEDPSRFAFIASELKDFVSIIEKIAAMPVEERAALGRRARQFVVENYSWESSAANLLKTLSSSASTEIVRNSAANS